MSKDMLLDIQGQGQSFLHGVAYNNFDVNASTDQPTLENHLKFHHATSALMFKLDHGVALRDLQYSKEVYAKSGLDLKHLDEYMKPTYEALLDAAAEYIDNLTMASI